MIAILSAKGLNLMAGAKLLPLVGALVLMAIAIIAGASLLKRRSIAYDATTPGLYGVTGRFGSGKSYFLTWMASICLKRGRLVFATYEIAGHRSFSEWRASFDAGELWIGPVLVTNWSEILQAPNDSLVIIDEAQGWWPSNAWNCPTEVKMWLSTIRHRGITVWWGTQWVNSVARWLRELSFGIWECEHFKAGHRYTLYDPRVIGAKKGTRTYDARIVLRRSADIMAMYDTHNDARSSVEWGGADAGMGASVGLRSTQAPPTLPTGRLRKPSNAS